MKQSLAVKTFEDLFAELGQRARTRPAGSRTVAALDSGVHAVGKKVLEEAGEVWLAAEHESDDALAENDAQEDRQRLPIRHLRPLLQFHQRAAPNRMLQHQERIRRQPHDAGDIARRHLERFSAQHHRPLAKLLETNAVMQTARRARASIAKAGDQKIHFG